MKAWISRSERKTNLAISTAYLFGTIVSAYTLWLMKVIFQDLATLQANLAFVFSVSFIAVAVTTAVLILFVLCLLGFVVLLEQGLTGRRY